ncbi:hypothetical protein lerEdw1_009148 [Lerista edwardsae]|nr:hypothetical protein lerEdw1_009148 [Lerista edwardsae]
MKRTGLLTECSTNQRDYNDVKQRLSQSCLDPECNLESLWLFDKIEMVHNKDLEEDFFAKRAKLREEGKQDKELSSFLVVSKDEVSKICQSGLCTSNYPYKRSMELGNPQLGVHLFRYVDIALNYAYKCSIQIEHIIIFRVLLGRVKGIQPPMGKKKIALDPTPNFDCHMSRFHPSLKDSVEDQAIGSLVYFYEYNEFSKPVDKPRQCLPYAVVKVKCVNQKVMVEYPIASSKSKTKKLPKKEGRGRGLPLENCTRVTRIGKNKLIYEHFRKPEENSAVNLENNAPTEVVSLSETIQNWNGSVDEIQCRKMNHKLNRWDLETRELNPTRTTNPLTVHPGVSPVCDSCSSTVITSRLIKDPRLTKRKQNLGKQDGEAVFRGILQCKNQLEHNSKIPTTLGLPYPVPDDFFLNTSKHAFSHSQFMEKVSWKERTLEECVPPSLLNKDKYYSMNGEQELGNISQLNDKILASQNTPIDHTSKTNLSHDSLKCEDYGNTNSDRISAGENTKSEGMKHSKVLLSLLGPSKIVSNEWKSQESEPVQMYNKKQEFTLELPFDHDTNINMCNLNLESVMLGRNEMANREKRSNQLQNHDGYTTETLCATDYDTSCAKNNDGSGSVQDYNLESIFHRKKYISEPWTEDICEWSLGYQMREEDCEQCKTQAILQCEKSSMTEIRNQINELVNSTSESSADERVEYIINKADDSSIKENISDVDNRMYLFHNACKTDITMRDSGENHMHICKPASLDNLFRDKEALKNIDKQRNLETDSVISTCGFDKVHTWQFKEESHCDEKSRRYTPEIQIFSSAETAGGQQKNFANKDLEKSVGNIKKFMEISDNLGLESSCSDFCLHFQEMCLKETQLMKIENDKEQLRDIHNQTLPTKCTSLTMHQKKNGPAFFLANTVFVPLENVKEIDSKKPESENPCSSKTNFVQKIPEQDFEAIYKDIIIPDIKVRSEIASEGCKKCPPVPQKSCYENMSEQAMYLYLQERMNGGSLFRKPTLNTQALGRSLRKESESLGRRKTGMEKKAELFNSSLVKPDLNITVTTIFQPKLNPKPKKSRKWSQEKKMKKYTQNQQKSKLYHKKEECETFAQSEKHIKNVLDTLHTEALLCKNKYLSQKINGAVFHLRKAQMSVRKSLNIVAKARKRRSHEVVRSDLSESCDAASYYGGSVIPDCILDMPCLSANVTNTSTTGHEVSEKSTSLDTKNIKTTNDAIYFNSDFERQKLAAYQPNKKDEDICEGNVKMSTLKLSTPLQTTSESSENVNTSHPDISRLSPIFKMLENCFSNEKEILEIPSIPQENMSVGIASSDTFKSSAEDKHNAQVSPIQLTPPTHEAGPLCTKTKSGSLSEINLERYCSDKLTEYFTRRTQDADVYCEKNMLQSEYCSPNKLNEIAEQKLYSAENGKYKQMAKTVNLENNADRPSSSNYQLSPISCFVLPDKTSQNITNVGSRLNEKCLSNEYPVDSENMQHMEAGNELKSLDFISEILQKADETSSLNILHKQVIVCRNVLPTVITAFEKKQGCSFEHVLVSREIVGNADRNMWAGHKLKPCAIESLIELQIIMETIEFIENKKRHIEGELTFRSLLWYDDSLYSELFGGQSGYQQQSNFYPAFQRRLKYNAFNELQSYHKQLIEVFENTRWQNHSYYSFLKSRREIEECEAALKGSSYFSDFFLSVPYVCGANYGDTLEDLEHSRKSTVDLINVCKSLPGIAFSAEKEDHLWIVMEIIATKIEFIKTCEEVNMKASLFGLEHIFFDAAKCLAWRERDRFMIEDGKDAKEQSLEINEAALSKFYGIYEHMVDKLGDGNFCNASEENVRNSSEESYNCENGERQQEANYYIENSLVLRLNIGCISKILDEAQSASVNKLQQLVNRCTEHLEILEKCFQILQKEENVSDLLITKENVLGFMKTGGINVVILKPDAVEVYTELAMVYETVSFLKNSIARKEDKPRFRSLLWFDESLLPELFRCQEKIASFSYRKDNVLKMIESSISELQDELNLVCDYAEKLNCSYAVHLLTRELRELSETRKLLQTSKSSISMCVDFVPYTICLNYGNTVSELECNYNQFSLLLEKLMMSDTKDFGKMAHIMKIMKTIEHMKFICTEQGKSPLPVVLFQMIKNWRKTCQLKRQDLNTHLDTNERHSTKHSIYVSSPQGLKYAAFGSQAQQKRPACLTSEDDPCTYEEKDYSFHSKKKKDRSKH